MSGEYGERVGLVTFTNFYMAIVSLLGCVKVDIQRKMGGGSFPSFAFSVSLPGQGNVIVPVFVENPMQHLREYRLPQVILVRGELEHDYAGINFLDIVYRKGVVGTERSDGGYGLYEVKRRGITGKVDFEVQMYAYSRAEADIIRNYIITRLRPPVGVLEVKDSLNKIRKFTYFFTSFSSITELVSIPERYVGYSYTITVLGEFDLFDNVSVERSITSFNLNFR